MHNPWCSDRIYPVPLKPASGISTWSGWPEDVRDLLHGWNHGAGLTFVRGGIFKCARCEEFCETHEHGRVEVRGVPYCDDCLIALARESRPDGGADPTAGQEGEIDVR